MVALLLIAVQSSYADVVLLTENFDSMGTAGTSPPAGWTIGYLGASGSQNRLAMTPHAGNGQAITSLAGGANFAVSNGTVGSGTPFALNLGTTGSSDRALGNFPRTSPFGDHIMQVQVTNNSGSALTDITLSYWGEQWKRFQGTAAEKPERLRVLYGDVSATDGFVYLGTAFDFNALQDLGGELVLDGNAAENRTLVTGSFTPAQPIADGATFWIRWHDWNDNSTSDHVLAIDDVQVSGVPEPGTLVMLLGAAVLGLVAWRRRRK
jgi:PEP-CTERM motif